MPRSYPPEFRRKVLDLVASGRRVAQIAIDLDISDQTIYNWRRQQLIDSGQLPGISSTDHAELVAARRRECGQLFWPRLVRFSSLVLAPPSGVLVVGGGVSSSVLAPPLCE